MNFGDLYDQAVRDILSLTYSNLFFTFTTCSAEEGQK